MFLRVLRVLIPCVVAGMAAGDVLTLSGGEVLQGQLVRIREGVIQFRTTLEGQIMAPADTVEALSTDRNLVITLQDETILFGRLAHESGENRLYPLDNAPGQPLQLGQVREAMPIPSPPPKDTPAYENALEDWKTSVQTGIRWHDSARSYVDAYLRVETERRLKDHLVEMDLTVERADRPDFPRFLEGSARFSQEPGSGLGLFGEITAERQTFNALELRTGLTVGLHLRETGAAATRDWEAGIQAVYESFDDRELVSVREMRSTEEAASLNLQLGLRYNRILGNDNTFQSALRIYPSLIDLGEARARSETSLTLPLTHRLQLRLELAIEYESDPVFDSIDPWSTTFGASLGFQF